MTSKHDAASGPFQNIMQTCCGNLDAAARGYEPMMKGLAQANLELIGFWNRRAQAILETQSRYCQCKTPQDVFAENVRFFQTAASQYQDSARKLMKLWAQSLPEMPVTMPGRERIERDYFSFFDHDKDHHRREHANGRKAA